MAARQVKVVTISASFGAGGSVIGPAVAQRLGLPFVDRALPVAVSRRLDWPLEDLLARDERPPSLLERLFGGIAASAELGGAVPAETGVTDLDYCATIGQVLRELAATSGGVVLGRAAALVLAGHPDVLHVRLDGDRAARLSRAAEGMGGDEEAAGQLLDRSDRDREGYVRYFYKADAKDPRHYHLMLDSTVIAFEVCTEIIIMAAQAGVSVTADGGPSGTTVH